MHWTDDSLHTVAACKTPTELMQFGRDEAKRLGMEYIALGTRFPVPLLDQRTLLFNNYPSRWVDIYSTKNYMAVDPTVLHGINSNLPVLYSNRDVQKAAPEMWEEAAEFGIKVGIAQSVFDMHGVISMLSMSRGSTEFTAAEFADKAPKILWLANLLHSGISNLILRRELPETAADLTPREKEVLKLAAAGLTSHEIGDRIKISKRTADFHIDSAASKLGSPNRTDAAVKAVVLKLV